jgi:predicted Zn finger-like uncharacterized protein
MSLITRCPACGTMFRVVPDQLRISEGWVRCGQCAEVFDAARNLQVLTPPVRSAAASLKPSSIPAQPLERTAPPPVVPMAEHTEGNSSESVDSPQAAPTSIDAEPEDAGMPQERPDQGLVMRMWPAAPCSSARKRLRLHRSKTTMRWRPSFALDLWRRRRSLPRRGLLRSKTQSRCWTKTCPSCARRGDRRSGASL